MIHGAIFPNSVLITTAPVQFGSDAEGQTAFYQMRMLNPIDAHSHEVVYFSLVPKDAPEEWKKKSYLFSIRQHGAASFFEADDLENFRRIDAGVSGIAGEDAPFNYELGIGADAGSPPPWNGPGRIVSQDLSESNQRNYIRRYLQVMEGGAVMTVQMTGVHTDLWDFLVNESAALDEHRQRDWLTFLADDFTYEIPVPRSREDLNESPYDMTTFLAHESKSFLQMRFARLESDHAWSEHPTAFFRHFISNLRVIDEVPGESWTVATNVHGRAVATARADDDVERRPGRHDRGDTGRPAPSEAARLPGHRAAD